MVLVMAASTRINISVPLDLAIQIDKDCEKRGILKTQYIKEAIYDKVKKNERNYEEELEKISKEIYDIKEIMRIIMNLLYSKKIESA
ncbi:MAG: hypothetical protein FADNKDHG_01451 [Holosporales bacterium]